ncbi:hypothetical protein J6590_022951 [Homalodisca vitripennis]|nr:hypothetical protein J6590_022951 [Homalodisca vitripennis]
MTNVRTNGSGRGVDVVLVRSCIVVDTSFRVAVQADTRTHAHVGGRVTSVAHTHCPVRTVKRHQHSLALIFQPRYIYITVTSPRCTIAECVTLNERYF